MNMKRLITLFALLFCIALAGLLSAGEDAGLAGAAYVRGFKKNASKQVAENVTLSDGAILEIATGSLASLAFRFRALPTTGIYAAANSFSIAVTGVEAMRWTTTQTLLIGSGSNTVPAVSWAGDSNTGISNDISDVISLLTGGNIRLTLSGTQATFNTKIAVYNAAGGAVINYQAASGILPSYSFNGNINTGLGRYQFGEPSMVASGTEAARYTIRGNMLAPMLASSAIDALTASESYTVYNTTAHKYQYFNGSVWKTFAGE